jgi:hypothetical protein
MSPERRAAPSAVLWAGLVLLALAAALRLIGLPEQVLMDDEWHALKMVQNHGYERIFSTFGHADHSIPVTLWYEWLTRHGGLDEMRMRASSLLPGLALLALFPWLLRRWLDPGERLTLLGLMAVSPFLIYYARFARPYSLLALLVSASLPLAWFWWYERRRVYGLAWCFCLVLAAWINPVSLSLTAAPVVWFGADALRRAGARDFRPVARLAILGVAAVTGVVALLWAPVANDWASLMVKSAVHRPNPETAWVLLSLWSGLGHGALVLAFCGLVLAGGLILWRRDTRFAAYLGLIAVLAPMSVWLSGAEWSQYGIVPARYLIGLLPFFLALGALGLVSLARRLKSRVKVPVTMSVVLTLAALVAFGPLPRWGLSDSQFVHHAVNYFDYDPRRNPFELYFANFQAEDFYREIGEQHPEGDALVLETYWHLESYWNPLYIHQELHGQRVRIGMFSGLCAEDVVGEIRPDAEGIELLNFVHIEDLLKEPWAMGDWAAIYLVLRPHGMEGSREHEIRFEECQAAVEASLGPPWRETGDAFVYRWPRPAESRQD